MTALTALARMNATRAALRERENPERLIEERQALAERVDQVWENVELSEQRLAQFREAVEHLETTDVLAAALTPLSCSEAQADQLKRMAKEDSDATQKIRQQTVELRKRAEYLADVEEAKRKALAAMPTLADDFLRVVGPSLVRTIQMGGHSNTFLKGRK